MDDQAKLLLEIQSNASNAVGDLQKLVDTLGKLSGQTEKTKQEAQKASQGFTDLQAKIVATYAAFGILGQAYNTAIGTIRRGTDATIGQARAFAEYNQQLKNVTTQLGITSQFYQVLEARLQRLGLGTDAARASLFIFNRTIEAARQGAGEAAEVIQRLNVNVDRTRNIEAIYLDVAKAITALGSSTERAQAAQTLFGRQGAQQIVVLEELAQGSREFEQRLKSLGIVMDQSMVQSATRADKALSEMNEAMKGLGTQWQRAMTETFAPTIENVSKLLTTMAEKVNGSRIEVNAFIEATVTMSLMVMGPAGAVAAVTALVKAIGAIRVAFLGLQAAAGPLGWLTALIGALGSAAIAWGLFGDKVDAAADKLERARGIAKGDKYNQFWETGEEPNWPLPGTGADSRDIAEVRDIAAATTGGASASRTPTEIQTQRDRQALQGYMQALAQAQVAEVERTRGQVAAIQERLKWRKEEIDQEERWAIKDAQLKGDEKNRKQEVESIQKAAKAERAAAELAAETEQQQALLDLSDAFGQEALEHLEAMGEQRLALQRVHAQTQLDLQQISFDEYFALQRQFATEEYQLAVERNARQLALAHAGTAERRAILDERERLELDHQVKLAEIEADAARTAKQQRDTVQDLTDTVQAVHLEAFGTPAQQRIHALMVEQERLIKQLGNAGLTGEIEKVRAAYARLIEEATPGFVHLGRTISQSVGGGLADVLSGAEDAKDVLTGLQDSFRKSFADAFSAALQEKLHFDAALNVNFLKDIPAMASKGASSIATTFSNLFDYLSGGGGVGGRVNVNESAATGTAGGGGSFDLGSFTSLFGAGSAGATTTLAGGSAINVGSLASTYGGAIGGTTAGTGIYGAALGGATTGASGTAAGAAGGGGAGGASGAAMAAVFIMMAIGAITEGIKSYKANKYRLDLSEDELRNKSYGDAVAGAFDAVGFGGIGELLGGAAEKSPAWLQEVLTPFVSPWFMKQLGLFKQPSRGKQAKKLTSEAFQDIDTFFPIYQKSIHSGGYEAMRVGGFELPTTEAEAAAFEAMGYTRQISFEKNRADVAAGLVSGQGLLDLMGVDDALAKYAQPGVSGLRTGPVLGLAQVLFGGVPGADAASVQYGANTITNTMMAAGMSEQEAREEVRALFDDFGQTFSSSTLSLRTQGLESNITSMEQMKAGIDGVVEAFRDDLPPSLDAAALAMDYLNEVEGKIVFNARAYNEEVEHLTQIYQARVSTMSTGFAEGINAAVDTMLAARAAVEAALSADTPDIAALVGMVGAGEKAFKGTMAQSFAQAMRQDLITSAYDRVTDSDDVNSPWNRLTSGNLDVAELPATMAALWAQVNREIRAVLIPLEAIDDYFISMGESTAEIGVNLGDVVGQIDGLVRGALGEALQAFFTMREETEANAAAAAQAEQERQSRLAFLAVSIDQARLFGDEIRAAELAMEQQTLAAVRANQDVVDSIDEVYQKAIKEGLQQAVIQGMIEAIASSGAMQAALVPYFEALQEYVDALAGGNRRAINGARLRLIREAENVENTLLLDGVFAFPDEVIPDLFADERDSLLAVPGSNTALLDGGSGQSQGGGFGGIVVNVTGNYIGDQATADHLVAQIEATMLQRMQMNNLVGH